MVEAVPHVAVKIDTQTPNAPSQPTVPGSVVSGNFVYSNNTTPTFNGTAEPGSTPTILASGQVKGTVITDLTGLKKIKHFLRFLLLLFPEKN